MIENKRKISYDNRGSALIMALVVSAVLMVLSLSLLAVSYSFFLSQKKNTGGTNERELFYSAVEVFEQELIDGGHKILDEKATEKMLKDNMDDDSLFGTHIVDSIFCNCEGKDLRTIKDEAKSKIPEWKSFKTEEYEAFDEAGKIEYIDSKSRFFNLTCFGAYSVSAQMYWEFDNSSDDSDEIDLNDEKDDMNGILLHVIYRLKKNEEIIIKNERVYKLVTPDSGETNSDTTSESTVPYRFKFGVTNISGQTKDEDRYKVSLDFFPGMELSTDKLQYPMIWVGDQEFEVNLFERYKYLKRQDIFGTWYTDSKKTKVWNGTFQQFWGNDTPSTADNKIQIARTDWNGAVPVRIKFVINGYYMDLDKYAYRYIKYVDGKSGSQAFTEKDLNDNFSDELLATCGITEPGDDLGSIKWMLKDGDNYTEFFNGGIPTIDKEVEDFALTYYVFATFPSFYEDPINYTGLKLEAIQPYDENSIISFDEISDYTLYSFVRIIGE